MPFVQKRKYNPNVPIVVDRDKPILPADTSSGTGSGGSSGDMGEGGTFNQDVSEAEADPRETLTGLPEKELTPREIREKSALEKEMGPRLRQMFGQTKSQEEIAAMIEKEWQRVLRNGRVHGWAEEVKKADTAE